MGQASAPPATERDGAAGVKSVDRALRVLLYLASRARPAETRTIAREVGMPKSSAYALLNVMRQQEFVTYYPERRTWGLGVLAHGLAGSYLRTRPLERLADTALARLSEATGEVSHLGEMYGTDVLVLSATHPSGRGTALTVDVGSRIPACLSASGRAMLMHRSAEQLEAMYPSWRPYLGRTIAGRVLTLQRLRAELEHAKNIGYAVNNELNIPGILSFAAPVFGADSLPVAAIGITTLSSTRAPNEHEALAQIVCKFASELSKDLDARRAWAEGSPAT